MALVGFEGRIRLEVDKVFIKFKTFYTSLLEGAPQILKAWETLSYAVIKYKSEKISTIIVWTSMGE